MRVQKEREEKEYPTTMSKESRIEKRRGQEQVLVAAMVVAMAKSQRASWFSCLHGTHSILLHKENHFLYLLSSLDGTGIQFSFLSMPHALMSVHSY
jgi:hypothetical protein